MTNIFSKLAFCHVLIVLNSMKVKKYNNCLVERGSLNNEKDETPYLDAVFYFALPELSNPLTRTIFALLKRFRTKGRDLKAVPCYNNIDMALPGASCVGGIGHMHETRVSETILNNDQIHSVSL